MRTKHDIKKVRLHVHKMPIIIYVLKCQDDDKFFVGSSNRKLKNPLKYFSDHNQDLSYLEDHPMNELVSTSTVDSLDDVDKEVVRLMTMYGALNVRGGSYTSLNKETIIRVMIVLFTIQTMTVIMSHRNMTVIYMILKTIAIVAQITVCK